MRKKVFSTIRIAMGIAAWIIAMLLWEYWGFIVGAFVALALAPGGFYAK